MDPVATVGPWDPTMKTLIVDPVQAFGPCIAIRRGGLRARILVFSRTNSKSSLVPKAKDFAWMSLKHLGRFLSRPNGPPSILGLNHRKENNSVMRCRTHGIALVATLLSSLLISTASMLAQG